MLSQRFKLEDGLMRSWADKVVKGTEVNQIYQLNDTKNDVNIAFNNDLKKLNLDFIYLQWFLFEATMFSKHKRNIILQDML